MTLELPNMPPLVQIEIRHGQPPIIGLSIPPREACQMLAQVLEELRFRALEEHSKLISRVG